jgi:regulator of RNase E activity RraB
VEAFKLGYEVTEPEELEVEEGDTVICCDILSEAR